MVLLSRLENSSNYNNITIVVAAVKILRVKVATTVTMNTPITILVVVAR